MTGRHSAGGGDPLVRVDELVAHLQTRLARDELKLREAAAEAGVSAATLSRVLHGKLPDTTTFAALVRWLGVSADVFIAPGQRPTGPELIEAHLRADRTLPPATAQALAQLVRATYADFSAAGGQPT